MSSSGSKLEGECAVFTSHLIGLTPTPYVVEKYIEAHDHLPELAPSTRFDALLTRIARSSRGLIRIADAYAGLFARNSQLRRKLALLLAILESSPELHRRLDAVDSASRSWLAAVFAGQATVWLISTIAGVFLFVPLRALVSLTGKAGWAWRP